MKRKIWLTAKCLRSFFSYLGMTNWHHGVDNPTIWQRLYKWRIGPKTAWIIATGIWFDRFTNNPNNPLKYAKGRRYPNGR